ncbi:MAG TPA: XRE family transcriptional regulator [Desulfomonilaceae bacterium]|nr:XRE family transcriptional regulator [Desulfomonilaceae bacterium]
MTTFGEYAKLRMRQLGRSQKALAAELGVSPAYVSQIMNRKKNPPDLSRVKYRSALKTWCRFLDSPEDDILDMVRFELHRVPPRPNPKFRAMRELLIGSLKIKQKELVEEIRAMALHPAENRAIHALVQIYLALQEEDGESRAYGATRFRNLCIRARADREFVEGELVGFFGLHAFSWVWDPESDDVRLFSESGEILRAIERVRGILDGTPGLTYPRTVPVVGHVSAGKGFEYTDGGFAAGEGFDQVEIPPGVDPALGQALYCVKVRGDSLREFFGDGALLFIKPESWEEVKDGDLVIFKDRKGGRAFVKKVEFAGDSLILKSMNPLYKNIVLNQSDLMLLERVIALKF